MAELGVSVDNACKLIDQLRETVASARAVFVSMSGPGEFGSCMYCHMMETHATHCIVSRWLEAHPEP